VRHDWTPAAQAAGVIGPQATSGELHRRLYMLEQIWARANPDFWRARSDEPAARLDAVAWRLYIGAGHGVALSNAERLMTPTADDRGGSVFVPRRKAGFCCQRR